MAQLWLAKLFLLLSHATAVSAGPSPAPLPAWRQWMADYGRDVFQFPDWIREQMQDCVCSRTPDTSFFRCNEKGELVSSKATELTFCVAKAYMLNRMPTFDQHYLPPSVTVDGQSMFDDNIAFALMANNASLFMHKLPLELRLAYVLPYASYHEPRSNWRGLFFAKFFNKSFHATSTLEAMQSLLPHAFQDWSGSPPLESEMPGAEGADQSNWKIGWRSSTAPPVLAPFDFIAYRTGSCTAWATMITYVLRSVGVPARQAGTPCWNSALGGTDFTGLAINNPNVSKCWHGGAKAGGKMTFGNDFLNNHNWVELWDDRTATWVHVNTPPQSNVPNAGLCSYNESTGCDYDPVKGCEGAGKLGKAMRDHPIFSPSWSLQGDIDGEEIVDSATLTLSTGEPVSPLVWASNLRNVLGEALAQDGLRMLNRTAQYRCHAPSSSIDGSASIV